MQLLYPDRLSLQCNKDWPLIFPIVLHLSATHIGSWCVSSAYPPVQAPHSIRSIEKIGAFQHILFGAIRLHFD